MLALNLLLFLCFVLHSPLGIIKRKYFVPQFSSWDGKTFNKIKKKIGRAGVILVASDVLVLSNDLHELFIMAQQHWPHHNNIYIFILRTFGSEFHTVQLCFPSISLALLHIYVIICPLAVQTLSDNLFLNWQLSLWTLDGIVAVQEPCNLQLYFIFFSLRYSICLGRGRHYAVLHCNVLLVDLNIKIYISDAFMALFQNAESETDRRRRRSDSGKDFSSQTTRRSHLTPQITHVTPGSSTRPERGV